MYRLCCQRYFNTASYYSVILVEAHYMYTATSITFEQVELIEQADLLDTHRVTVT